MAIDVGLGGGGGRYRPAGETPGGALSLGQIWAAILPWYRQMVQQQAQTRAAAQPLAQLPAWPAPAPGVAPAPVPANWWEVPGAMQPTAPAAEPVAVPSPWEVFAPTREAVTGPTRQLWLRPQDWLAIPAEVRQAAIRWLRGRGWRAGGAWGRYGPTLWEQPTAQPAYEEQAFAGVPENLKAWLWWLFTQKGYTAAAPEAVARPEVTGWTW